ncbi:MAG: sigma-70 family RNA polymerase sigma factor [Candidatus Riflebacteria bacterium]|nr:sigma-70 family RNA polymerase sigma factor [Candidatus Riflebacteria bacterium]
MLNETLKNDAHISAEALKQEPITLASMLQTYQDQIVNTCYGFLHNRSDAEDASQEVFLKAWKAIPTFRGECKLSTWLYRIATRTSLDILRKRKRDQRWNWVLGLVGLNKLPAVTPSEKDPLVVIEQRERAKILMKAIDNLPETQRTAYTLANFENLQGKEIAEIMETSVTAVESLLFRSRKGLREHLQSYYQKDTTPGCPEENTKKE